MVDLTSLQHLYSLNKEDGIAFYSGAVASSLQLSRFLVQTPPLIPSLLQHLHCGSSFHAVSNTYQPRTPPYTTYQWQTEIFSQHSPGFLIFF